MIAAAHLLVLLALSLPSIDAFSAALPSTRCNVNGRLLSVPNARTTRSSQLFDRSSPPSQSTPMASESNLFHQITTGVGKTASTLVSASVFVLLAYQRDAVILTIWLGSILNAVLSKVVKKLLNHERPAALQDNDKVKLKPSDGGMPSSHAMSLGFIGASICGGIVPVEYRVVAGVAMAIYSAIALRYRVRDHFHTIEQVVVGLVFGVGNALAWLKFGVGDSTAAAGPILSWVRDHWVSPETGLFPYSALAIPIVVGVLVVGSFERRIKDRMNNKNA